MKITNPYNFSYIRAIILMFILFIAATCYAHSWMAPKSEANRKNPIPKTNESVQIGSEIFGELCASCHGQKGMGLKKQETGLSKDTPKLPARLSTHSDGDFHWKILNGKGEMPSFENEVSDEKVWHIINYLKAQ